MASPPVIVQLAHADPNASPITINEQIDLFNTLFSGAILGDYRPYILSNTEPGPDQRDYVWIQQDSRGAPIAVKTWYPSPTVAAWRRVYNGMMGEIRGYSGVSGVPNWDVNGLGAIGGIYDGWQICNGKNGSPNLSDQFIVGAHMDDSNGHSGYDNGWKTFVDGTSDLGIGGSKSTMIQEKNLPPLDTSMGDDPDHPGTPESTGLWIHGKGWKDDAVHSSAVPIVDVNYGAMRTHDVLIATYGADPNGTPPVPQEEFPTLPPFVALAWIIFVGYG